MAKKEIEKKCLICKKFKPLSEFHKCKGGTYDRYSYCKPCSKIKNKRWNRKNRKRHIERVKRWARENKDKVNAYHRLYRKRNKKKMNKRRMEIYNRKKGKAQ